MAKFTICSKSSEGRLRTYIESIEIDEYKSTESGTQIFYKGEWLGTIPSDLCIIRSDMSKEIIMFEDEKEIEEWREFTKSYKQKLNSLKINQEE